MIFVVYFFFNDTATTEIYTLSLHDALPISCEQAAVAGHEERAGLDWYSFTVAFKGVLLEGDRKSTRLNSSHPSISYAVFCLKKKKKKKKTKQEKKKTKQKKKKKKKRKTT